VVLGPLVLDPLVLDPLVLDPLVLDPLSEDELDPLPDVVVEPNPVPPLPAENARALDRWRWRLRGACDRGAAAADPVAAAAMVTTARLGTSRRVKRNDSLFQSADGVS
jgi:hypothetical protein